MKMTLISLDHEVFCPNIRILSACLRESGHMVNLVFLPPRTGRRINHKFRYIYCPGLLDSVREVCSDSGVVGISLMTNQFLQAINVTEFLKKNLKEIPVVWGGIQATVEPEICLQYADIVCLGEGERAIVELAEKMDKGRAFHETGNMWFKSGKEIIRNPLRPLINDLDSLPLPDYSCRNHYIAVDDILEPVTAKTIAAFKGERFVPLNKKIHYPVMTSRGCPFSCSYCCNSVYKRLYPGQKLLRWRSADTVVKELKMIEDEIAPVGFVYMVDDNFTARPTADLEEFCRTYKMHINKPFYCQVSPLTVCDEKLEILLKYGCGKVTMGVETASKRIAEMYGRGQFHSKIQSKIALIERYRHRMSRSPSYQFIIDNPYETIDETIETLHLALSLPRPWHSPVYSLMLFPGTPLYEKTMSEGYISDKYAQIYCRNWLEQSKPFLQLWIRLYRANMPRFLLRFLLNRNIVLFMTGKLLDFVWRMPVVKRVWS